MARAESKEILGYLPLSPHHYAAVLSLITPATPATRMLDPYAGEGEFLEAAAKAWNLTPYANELDGERAQKCVERFGPTQAVRCDVERLVASNEAFGILWANPPYDHDKVAKVSKRVEFAYLRHAWKWAADGAIILWVVYNHHLTEEVAASSPKTAAVSMSGRCRGSIWASMTRSSSPPSKAHSPNPARSTMRSCEKRRNRIRSWFRRSQSIASRHPLTQTGSLCSRPT